MKNLNIELQPFLKYLEEEAYPEEIYCEKFIENIEHIFIMMESKLIFNVEEDYLIEILNKFFGFIKTLNLIGIFCKGINDNFLNMINQIKDFLRDMAFDYQVDYKKKLKTLFIKAKIIDTVKILRKPVQISKISKLR